MIQWEYQISIHELPEPEADQKKRTIECDQKGQCLVHEAIQGSLEWLENLFREKGMMGWELVQAGYHHRELLCIWKKRREAEL
jgi:hypothetical protein